MIVTWVTGWVYDEPGRFDFNFRDGDKDTARPISDIQVKSTEFVEETFGKRVEGELDLWVVPETEVLYRGTGVDCDATVLDEGRPAWFGSPETARKYAAKGRNAENGVAAFRPTKPLVLFDLFSAKNMRKLLEHHAGDADLCQLIRRATGFERKRQVRGEVPGKNEWAILEILDPSVPVRSDNEYNEFERTILHEGRPAKVVMLPDNKLYHRVRDGEYVELRTLDCVDLGSHLAGRCEAGFTRASGDTAGDTLILNAIRDLCAVEYPEVVGYHGAKTFTGNVFHAEIALFDGAPLMEKDCGAVGGGDRRSAWLVDAALATVVLVAAVLA